MTKKNVYEYVKFFDDDDDDDDDKVINRWRSSGDSAKFCTLCCYFNKDNVDIFCPCFTAKQDVFFLPNSLKSSNARVIITIKAGYNTKNKANIA